MTATELNEIRGRSSQGVATPQDVKALLRFVDAMLEEVRENEQMIDGEWGPFGCCGKSDCPKCLGTGIQRGSELLFALEGRGRHWRDDRAKSTTAGTGSRPFDV